MTFNISTNGFCDIVDITEKVVGIASDAGVKDGVAHVFVEGSTAALSATEFEPGAIRDLKETLERIVPKDARYHHNDAWGDGNGHAHIRAALMKPSMSIPIVAGKLRLGTWQQVVLLDFDNRQRRRTIHVQVTACS